MEKESKIARRVSSRAPKQISCLEPGPVKAFRLTQREADSWESARFLSIFLDLSWFRERGVISPRPGSAYAGRWAAFE